MRRNLERPVTSLSFDNFQKLLDSGNFRYVGLHGWGEPLLNQQLFEMVKYAEAKGVSTNLTTNGTLVRENIDRIFGSGLREIAFGIYDRQLFTQCLPQISDLTTEKKRRHSKIPKTYLDITIYKDNLAQIPDLVRLAPELSVDAVILHRLFNVYKVDPSIEYISAEEEDELFAEVRRLARVLKLELYLPPKHSFPCRIVKRSIFVTVEGEVTPCCFLPEFYLGNALEQGVGRVMRSKAYAEFVKNMKQHPICSKCRW
jgi:MoaA/NifB/PqqE/SkfB family radical SAM enzyme